MKLTVTPLDLSGIVISDEQEQPRTAGVHVSGIIKHIKATLGAEKSKFTEDDLEDFALVGRLWERVLADALYLPPRYERVGEIEVDDIIGSPDCLDTKEWAVREIKVCWQSSKAFEERQKFREYLYQIKAYCFMLGCPRAYLDVLHIRGDYTTGKPIPMTYACLFTTQELKENFLMLKRNIP